MKLVFLGGGDKGCASDNHQITKGKQHRDTVGVNELCYRRVQAQQPLRP